MSHTSVVKCYSVFLTAQLAVIVAPQWWNSFHYLLQLRSESVFVHWSWKSPFGSAISYNAWCDRRERAHEFSAPRSSLFLKRHRITIPRVHSRRSDLISHAFQSPWGQLRRLPLDKHNILPAWHTENRVISMASALLPSSQAKLPSADLITCSYTFMYTYKLKVMRFKLVSAQSNATCDEVIKLQSGSHWWAKVSVNTVA